VVESISGYAARLVPARKQIQARRLPLERRLSGDAPQAVRLETNVPGFGLGKSERL
jgi:hypothetical protein